MADYRMGDMLRLGQSLRAEPAHLLSNNLRGLDHVAHHLKARLAGKPLRAYYTYCLAGYLAPHVTGRRKELLYRQLPFLLEGIITIQYLHNRQLDDKASVNEWKQLLLDANLLKDSLYRYVEERLPQAARPAVRNWLSACFSATDRGQQLERQANTYAAYRRGITLSDCQALVPECATHDLRAYGTERFAAHLRAELPGHLHSALEIYLHRAYLTCAHLFVRTAELLCDLQRIGGKQRTAVLRFAVNYGMMRQIVNDNADFVPAGYGLSTIGRPAAAAQSDLRRGVLTLPLICALAHQPRGMVAELLSDPTKEVDQAAVFAEMIAGGALGQSMQAGQLLAELAVSLIPATAEATAPVSLLAATTEIAFDSRFLRPCRAHAAYAAYRKTAAHRRRLGLIRRVRAARFQAPAPPVPTLVERIATIFRPAGLPDFPAGWELLT